MTLVVALLILLAVSCRHSAPIVPGTLSNVAISIGGKPREYLLYSPLSLIDAPQARPLVIVLHGGGGSAKQIMREVGGTLFQLAETHEFRIAFPDAVNKMWDFGDGKVSIELDERIDDRSYFEAMLDDVASKASIDGDRIFATGISRGGQASYFFACEFPGRIRAIAPVAMPLPEFMADRCRSGPPVGVAIINGTDDPLVPYEGGEIRVGRRERGKVLSTDASLELWRQRNGCNSEVVSTSRLDPFRDRTHVDVKEWRDCEGAPVLLYKIVGGGHTWPSGSQYLPRFVIGRVTTDIDGAAVAWKFFSEFN